jgi:hypothetical protein
MGRDRYERKHRRTARHPECVRMMADADFDAVPSLAEAMGLEGQSDRPSNFVAEVNGHQIYRRPDDPDRCDVWTPGVGWWAFGLSESAARQLAATVQPPKS